jgi:GNAT superfamily N-acetyltransferase
MPQSTQHIIIRPALDADADECGRICYAGFRAVNDRHGFAPIFPSAEAATRRVAAFIRHPAIFAVVADTRGDGGGIVGFNFLSERDPIRSIGPIVIDPAAQARGIGRRLMEAVLERASGSRGIRLLQETYNMQSLSLYTSLGFDAREVFVVLEGIPQSTQHDPEWQIRRLNEVDMQSCEELHERVHGYSRTSELRDALVTGAPTAAVRSGRVCAYMAAPTNWLANHGVAETDEDMCALLVGAARMARQPLSFLLPVRRSALFRWCVSKGFRSSRPMTLMTIGEYRKPQNPYCPSVNY